MSNKILRTGYMGFQLEVLNPYIACMHHWDNFPAGNKNMEPTSYIEDRQQGSDFNPGAPWRMYHGEKIPGFPVHPHRGFETVTVVTQGFVDHSDGLGAAGRYGEGDVQWMTAGKGLQHAEMFPLLNEDKENPMELFQIWLNLPKKDKFVEPHYKMLWNEQIPVIKEADGDGNKLEIRLIAGKYKKFKALPPNPDSWAAKEENGVGILLITLAPHAALTFEGGSKTLGRMLYFYEGDTLDVEGSPLKKSTYAQLAGNADVTIKNGSQEGKLLLLEGEPIQEPVTAYGPFVMNTREEVAEAYRDYRETQFGGWPWDTEDPVSPKDKGRYALYSDGREERP